MLDLGGASTQITYVRPAGSPASVYDTSLRLYGATHRLYARSYMCFGQTQLLKRYLLLLVKVSAGSARTLFNERCLRRRRDDIGFDVGIDAAMGPNTNTPSLFRHTSSIRQTLRTCRFEDHFGVDFDI